MEKRAAAQAFSDRLNATPAEGAEADRFRSAVDRLSSMKREAPQALLRLEEVPADVAAVMECWCLLHGKAPSSEQCLKLLKEEPAEDFTLVGMSNINCLTEEELAEMRRRLPAAATSDGEAGEAGEAGRVKIS
ncbi:unnamed protein product [Effrenium voratum]|nr:unnamed protein product [Effrenium voratum]